MHGMTHTRVMGAMVETEVVGHTGKGRQKKVLGFDSQKMEGGLLAFLIALYLLVARNSCRVRLLQNCARHPICELWE
jgi:hypothetical protein